MKKKILICLGLFLSMALASCGGSKSVSSSRYVSGGGGVSQSGYSVTFDARGGSAVSTKYGTVSSSPSTSRSGYTFGGWYKGSSSYSPVSFPFIPSSSTTLYAKWTNNKGSTLLSFLKKNGEVIYSETGYTGYSYSIDNNLSSSSGESYIIIGTEWNNYDDTDFSFTYGQAKASDTGGYPMLMALGTYNHVFGESLGTGGTGSWIYEMSKSSEYEATIAIKGCAFSDSGTMMSYGSASINSSTFPSSYDISSAGSTTANCLIVGFNWYQSFADNNGLPRIS